MKWPEYLMLIRHDTSAYNVLKERKAKDPIYQEFQRIFEKDPTSQKTVALARRVWAKYALSCSDADTPLADTEGKQAVITGQKLREEFKPPDVVFVSPYKRALDTLAFLKKGWPEIVGVKTVKEERIREQEHGLASLYNDWRVFQTLHPEQKLLYDLAGLYRYKYPQGESVPDVRARSLLMTATITRDFAEKKVLCICHHLNILAMRANFERLDEKEFIRLDKEEKPINCGVTLYRGYPELGENGRLVLDFYNRRYY
jgi:broad specificity phosphatase PhoE